MNLLGDTLVEYKKGMKVSRSGMGQAENQPLGRALWAGQHGFSSTDCLDP